MRIPFDSLCLSAVVVEIQKLVGARVQGVRQPDPLTLVLALYGGREEWLLLSADPEFARVHWVSRRPPKMEEPPAFGQEVRRRLDGTRLVSVKQRGLDRVLDLEFDGGVTLVAELMGKHANLMLVEGGKVVAAAKWLGHGKTKRPVLPNQPYAPPPFEPRPTLLTAKEGDPLRSFDGCSPFLEKLIAAVGLEPIQLSWRERSFGAFYVEGSGAYPISVASLGLREVQRESLSQALEQHFESQIAERALVRLRSRLLSQLGRVRLAREVAISGLEEASDAAQRSSDMQVQGQLLLAYASSIPAGVAEAEVFDFEGNPIVISLNPALTVLENANRLFDKAKRAKSAAGEVEEQLHRLRTDLKMLDETLYRVEQAAALPELKALEEEADTRHWLFHQPVPTRTKEERPYQGHAVRELVAPGGWKVLYGENATANDYLTLRVGKPNDWWLHVRGAVSAHVLILTQNQPDRVSRDAILFAAQVAVRHSPSKHSGYVPVDYCLKKYVRRPRGAPLGTVTYSHEKTIHVER